LTGSLSFLSKKEAEVLVTVSEIILGVPKDSLGEDFILEADRYLSGMPGFLAKDLHLLFFIFNMRLTGLLLVLRFKKFSKMNYKMKEKYFRKWIHHWIPLLRTGAIGLKSLAGWAYYSQEKNLLIEVPDFPGRTIGKEQKTPTLLFGKQPWVLGKEKLKIEFISAEKQPNTIGRVK
jgi:hypothetical protein